MSETLLYGGKVKLKFDQHKHSYIVTEDGGEPVAVPSVTQILGIIDKSGPLTQWAANCAIDWLRTRIEAGKSYSSEELELAFQDARFNFRKVTKKAQDIGTQAHAWIESYIQATVRSMPLPSLPEDGDVRRSCQAAIDWLDQHKVSFVDTETKIYSRLYGYAGTLDCVAEVDGRTALIDWKTSAAIYPEYRLQLAAYAQAYSEMSGGEDIPERWIVRLDKTGLGIEDVRFDKFDHDFRGFVDAMGLWHRLKSIKNEGCESDD